MTQANSYPLLTKEQMAHVLRLTNPHSFEHNIRRMNAMYKLPIVTEPSLDQLTRPNGDLETAVQRMTGFLQTLKDECAEGDEIHWKLKLVEHHSITPEQVKEQGWIRTHEQVSFELLQRMKEDFVPPTSQNFGSKPEYSYPKDGEKTWAKLLAFEKLCAADLEEAKKDVLTDIADWLGDIMVYCRSEAMKFGLPLEGALDVIMGSNFTKLPSDGIPIHDANGKFLKDMTNFVPPEPALKTLMFGLKASSDEVKTIGTFPHAEPVSIAGLASDVEVQAGPNAMLGAFPSQTFKHPRHPYEKASEQTPDEGI